MVNPWPLSSKPSLSAQRPQLRRLVIEGYSSVPEVNCLAIRVWDDFCHLAAILLRLVTNKSPNDFLHLDWFALVVVHCFDANADSPARHEIMAIARRRTAPFTVAVTPLCTHGSAQDFYQRSKPW